MSISASGKSGGFHFQSKLQGIVQDELKNRFCRTNSLLSYKRAFYNISVLNIL